MDFFESEKEILDEDILQVLEEDLSLARKELKALATLRSGTQGIKHFFDYLHLGPLKVIKSEAKKTGHFQKLAINKKSTIFVLSS